MCCSPITNSREDRMQDREAPPGTGTRLGYFPAPPLPPFSCWVVWGWYVVWSSRSQRSPDTETHARTHAFKFQSSSHSRLSPNTPPGDHAAIQGEGALGCAHRQRGAAGGGQGGGGQAGGRGQGGQGGEDMRVGGYANGVGKTRMGRRHDGRPRMTLHCSVALEAPTSRSVHTLSVSNRCVVRGTLQRPVPHADIVPCRAAARPPPPTRRTRRWRPPPRPRWRGCCGPRRSWPRWRRGGARAGGGGVGGGRGLAGLGRDWPGWSLTSYCTLVTVASLPRLSTFPGTAHAAVHRLAHTC